jgi:hypothetical protein
MAATSTTAPSLPVRCLGSISLTISDAFHGCSNQPYMNSHPLEEPPHDLHTGQLIAQRNGSKYSNISNTTFSFIPCLLHCRDAGAFLGHTQLPAQSTATFSADTGVAEPKVWYMGSWCYDSWPGTKLTPISIRLRQYIQCSCDRVVSRSLLSESHTCHTHLGLTDNQITFISRWGYDTSIQSRRIKFMLNLPVCWAFLASSFSGRSVDPQHPVYKWHHLQYVSKNPPGTPSYVSMSIFAHSHLVSFCCLVGQSRIQLVQMALSSQWSDSVIQWGANSDHWRWYLPNFICHQHFSILRLLYFPFRAEAQSVIDTPLGWTVTIDRYIAL